MKLFGNKISSWVEIKKKQDQWLMLLITKLNAWELAMYQKQILNIATLTDCAHGISAREVMFSPVCVFVCLWVRVLKNNSTDFHETCGAGQGGSRDLRSLSLTLSGGEFRILFVDFSENNSKILMKKTRQISETDANQKNDFVWSI